MLKNDVKRKLIQLGDSSFAITLPNHWIKENRLSKADEVKLTICNNEIIISNKDKKEIKTVTLDLRGKSKKFCWFSISTQYMKGIEELEILCDKDNIEAVKQIVDFLVGAVIISENNYELNVECISEPNENLKEKVLNKLIFKMRNLVEEAVTELLAKGSYEQFKEKDHELNRLFFYCIRALRKQNKIDNQDVLLIQSFENIMDAFEEVVKENINSEKLKDFKTLFKKLTDIYFNPSKKGDLFGIYEFASELKNKCKNKAMKSVFNSVKRTIEIITPALN